MRELVIEQGRGTCTHSDLFKLALVDQCITHRTSLANVARQHNRHPTLLAQWAKKRTESTGVFEGYYGSTAHPAIQSHL